MPNASTPADWSSRVALLAFVVLFGVERATLMQTRLGSLERPESVAHFDLNQLFELFTLT
jgi:hypothetical protein